MTGSVGMMGSCQLFIDVCKERHFSTHYKEQQTLEGTFTIDMGGGDKCYLIQIQQNVCIFSNNTLQHFIMDIKGSMENGHWREHARWTMLFDTSAIKCLCILKQHFIFVSAQHLIRIYFFKAPKYCLGTCSQSLSRLKMKGDWI